MAVSEKGQNQQGQQNKGQKGQRAPKGKGKGKTNGFKGQAKGKGKTHSRPTGNRNSTTCGYCQKPGHEARECRKRLYDEKQKTTPTVTNNSQHPTHLHVDETTLMFSSNAVFAYPCDDRNGGDNIQHTGQEFNDHDETNPREETDEHKNEANADDDSTYRYSWQLQLQPSLLAIRASGPNSFPYNAHEIKDLQPHPNQTQTLETHLVMDELHMTATLETTPSVVTPTRKRNKKAAPLRSPKPPPSHPHGANTNKSFPSWACGTTINPQNNLITSIAIAPFVKPRW
jgi:hypothetical protein